MHEPVSLALSRASGGEGRCRGLGRIFRYGRPGAWDYYLIAKLSGCANGNGAPVRIVGGASKTVGCRGQAKLEPLTPKRTHRVVVSALLTRRRGPVKSGTAPRLTVHLPPAAAH